MAQEKIFTNCICLSQQTLDVLESNGITNVTTFTELVNLLLSSSAIDGIQNVFDIDFFETANPNEYTVSLRFEDENGQSVTIADSSPVTIPVGSGATGTMAAVTEIIAGVSREYVNYDANSDSVTDFQFAPGFSRIDNESFIGVNPGDANEIFAPNPLRRIVSDIDRVGDELIVDSIADHTASCVEFTGQEFFSDASDWQTNINAADLEIFNPSPHRHAQAFVTISWGPIRTFMDTGVVGQTILDYRIVADGVVEDVDEVIIQSNQSGGYFHTDGKAITKCYQIVPSGISGTPSSVVIGARLFLSEVDGLNGLRSYPLRISALVVTQ